MNKNSYYSLLDPRGFVIGGVLWTPFTCPTPFRNQRMIKSVTSIKSLLYMENYSFQNHSDFLMGLCIPLSREVEKEYQIFL